jgi:hypothetical protein
MERQDLGQLIGRIVEDTLGDGNCFLHSSYIRGVKQRNKKLKLKDGAGFAGGRGLDEDLSKASTQIGQVSALLARMTQFPTWKSCTRVRGATA